MRTAIGTTVSLRPDILSILKNIQKKEQKPRSVIIAEALRHYLWWKRFKTLQIELSMRAKRLGIRNEEDINRLIHNVR